VNGNQITESPPMLDNKLIQRLTVDDGSTLLVWPCKLNHQSYAIVNPIHMILWGHFLV